MNALLLLAQDFEVAETFSQKYFSFIVLGLLMTFGYVILRFRRDRSDRLDREATVEDELAKAEAEARRIAAERREGDGAGDVLALSPEQERERARIAAIAAPAAEQQQTEDPEEDRDEKFPL